MSEMAQKYLSGRHDKGWSNSLNTCGKVLQYFLIYYNIAHLNNLYERRGDNAGSQFFAARLS